jgi:sec-independent protein translocase protein TatC
MNFTDHLEEFRKRLITALIAVGLMSFIAYFFSDKIFNFLSSPLRSQDQILYFFAPSDAFFVRIKVALLTGVVLASPLLWYQLWHFVAPGLYDKEKRFVFPFLMASTFLFLLGVCFSFFIVIPFALNFLMGFETSALKPMLSVSLYLSFVSTLILSFGMAFNLPVAVTMGVATGLLKVETLKTYRRHTAVGILVLSSVLTPPDIISQICLGVPLYVLFEMSLLAGSFVEKSRKVFAEDTNQKQQLSGKVK